MTTPTRHAINPHDCSLRCPIVGCDGCPHVRISMLSRPKGSSGPCVVLEMFCEELHAWQLTFEDHSGTISTDTKLLPSLTHDPRFAAA